VGSKFPHSLFNINYHCSTVICLCIKKLWNDKTATMNCFCTIKDQLWLHINESKRWKNGDSDEYLHHYFRRFGYSIKKYNLHHKNSLQLAIGFRDVKYKIY
jgi:hypothetical protein